MTHQISGCVSELQVSAGTCDLGSTSNDEKLARGAANLSAVTVNVIKAAALSGASYGADVDMESFVCKVNDYTIHGMFHQVMFADGDVIDFVVNEDDERRLTASAARNQTTRCIWVEPYKTRGNAAQLRHDIFWSAVISFGSGLAAWAFFLSQFTSENALLLSSWIGGLLLCTLVVINYLVRKRFYPLSLEATTIFKVMGFSDPANVDLQKALAKAEVQWTEKNGGKITRHGPWQFRY